MGCARANSALFDFKSVPLVTYAKTYMYLYFKKSNKKTN